MSEHIPMLFGQKSVATVKGSFDTDMRSKSIPVRKEALSGSITLYLVLIPGKIMLGR